MEVEKLMKTYLPVTVIIPTYNRKKVLVDTINSFLQWTVIPDEIIVVDQNVPPLSKNDIAVNEEAHIRLLYCDTPSLTKARNIGIRNSRNDIILFSDDDILVDADSMMRFYNVMKHSTVALCAGVDTNSQKSSPIINRVFGTLIGMQNFMKSGGYVVRHTMRGRYSLREGRSSYKTDWAMGYFFGVKKTLVEKWQVYFDERLQGYAYAEDLDFTIRYCNSARCENLECVLNCAIYVNHLATQEWRTPTVKNMYYLVANRLYLLHKYYPNYILWPMKWNNLCYSFMLPKEERKAYNAIRRICMQNVDSLRLGEIDEVFREIDSLDKH